MALIPAPITQNTDVRFLGKLLGDVIRRHGGDALFQRIEAIRAASVDRYRGVANPRGLAAGWETLSLDETVAFGKKVSALTNGAHFVIDSVAELPDRRPVRRCPAVRQRPHQRPGRPARL